MCVWWDVSLREIREMPLLNGTDVAFPFWQEGWGHQMCPRVYGKEDFFLLIPRDCPVPCRLSAFFRAFFGREILMLA